MVVSLHCNNVLDVHAFLCSEKIYRNKDYVDYIKGLKYYKYIKVYKSSSVIM